ncbi:ATP-binding protein, partial [Nocardia sp. NPDC004722]
WAMQNALNGFQCDIVEPMYAQSLIDRYAGKPITWQGTVIRWDGVKDFPQHGERGQTDRYLQRTINKLGMHLGLQLHRFLHRDDFNITVAVEDIDTGTIYMDFSVLPLDPFGYPVSGRPDYPRTFTVQTGEAPPVEFKAHIWPPKSSIDQYRAIGSLMSRQGFYFYRHNRLVQAGGWNNFRQPEQHLSPARVAIDIPDGIGDLIRLTVKKDGVELAPHLIADLETAVDEHGARFGQYIADAEATYRDSRKRAGATRKPVIPPGRGMEPSVRETIEDELPVLPGEEPIDIRWSTLEGDVFFDLDREDRTIYLNKRFRTALLGGRRGGMNDVPMIKSLLFLLMHKAFEKEYSGSREKDNLQLWQSILFSAASAEEKRLSTDG